MAFRWRDNHTLLLLEHYRQYECLWNISSTEFKNRNSREKANKSIKDDMEISQFTVADIKAKIKNMRTYYNSELKKITVSERSGLGFGEAYVPKVFWFKEADLFLRKVSAAKNGSSNLVSHTIIKLLLAQKRKELRKE